MTENIHKFFTAVNRQQARPSANPAPQESPKKGPVKRKAQSLTESAPKNPRQYVQRGDKPPSLRTLEAWSAGRPWLRCDAVIGLHCAICFQNRDNVAVRGQGTALNTLSTGTKRYMFDTVKNHKSRRFHQAAVALDTAADV